MSSRDHLSKGVRVTATALCHWERTLQGGLRATWRPGCRVAGGASSPVHTPEVGVPLTREQLLHAVVDPVVSARRPSIDRWISRGFVAALYLLIAFAGTAIVVRA